MVEIIKLTFLRYFHGLNSPKRVDKFKELTNSHVRILFTNLQFFNDLIDIF